MSSLGERIESARILRKLKKKELANLLGVHESLIGKYERDEVDLTISKIKELAKVLDVTEAYLMGWEEIPKELDILEQVGVIAAHHDNNNEFTEEELESIRQFAEFVKNKNKK